MCFLNDNRPIMFPCSFSSIRHPNTSPELIIILLTSNTESILANDFVFTFCTGTDLHPTINTNSKMIAMIFFMILCFNPII